MAASIVLRPGATWMERTAAGDLQRVIYSATWKMLNITSGKANDTNIIALGFDAGQKVDLSNKALGDQGFVLKTFHKDGKTVLVAAGATPAATSYAAYTLAERYGAGFYLGGDALPKTQMPFAIPDLNEVHKPVFKIRGVLPWYNFFDSPTAWNIEDYRSFIDQLAKSKNNFLGFHSYDYEPFCAYKGKQGGMIAGAPLVSTAQSTWGTAPMKTADFSPNTRGYFEKDYFGADCSMGYKTPDEGIRNAQKLLAEALNYAKPRGVKTCVGFEMSGDPTAVGELDQFEMRLKNLLCTYPMVDYVWIWEPEAMGLRGSAVHPARSDFGAYYRRWEKVFADIEDPARRSEAVRVAIYTLAAHRIIEREAPKVRLILSAWGGDNHLKFTDFYPGLDKILPRDIIFSSLDNIVVSDTVSKAYGKLSKGREFWPIPWFEYDGDQWCPQPNTRRFYNAARDALKKGARGLLAIHWRTRDVEESHAYISDFAWNPNLGYEEFYRHYAKRAYGDERAAKLLMGLQDLGYRWIGGHGQTECGNFKWNPAPDDGVSRLNAIFGANPDIAPSERLYNLQAIRDWLVNYDQAARVLAESGSVHRTLALLKAGKRQPTADEQKQLQADLFSARQSLQRAMDAAARRIANRGELGILATVNTKAYASLVSIENEAKALGVTLSAPPAVGKQPLAVSPIIRTGTAFSGKSLRISAVVHGASPSAMADIIYANPRKDIFGVPLWFVSPGRLEGELPGKAIKGEVLEYRIRVVDGDRMATWPQGADEWATLAVVPPPPVVKPALNASRPALKADRKPVVCTTGPMLVDIKWNDDHSARMFRVMRATSDQKTWKEAGTTRDTWFEDRDVITGRRYCYRVVDADSGREVAGSAGVKVPEPPIPSAPVVQANAGIGKVRLTWAGSDENCRGYQVYRADAVDGPYTPLDTVTPAYSRAGKWAAVCRANPGVKYYYIVRGISLSGKVGPSSKAVEASAFDMTEAPAIDIKFDGTDARNIPSLAVDQGVPAMRVTADNFAEFANTAAYNPRDEITIAFWVKLLSSGVMPVLVSHGYWNADGYFIQYFNDQIRFFLGGVGTLDAGSLEIGKWTAIAATYDGNEMAIYIDGKKVGSKLAAGEICPSARSLYIGRYDSLGKEFEVDGYIGGFKMWPYAVEPDMLTAHYNELTYRLTAK